MICLSLLPLFLSGIALTARAADQTYTNSLGMEFVLIPAGSFTMGANKNSEKADNDESPHRVSISQAFYLGKYEVTQAQWMEVMGNNPSKFKDPGKPVENVSWDDAQKFIGRLNQKGGHARYRLPTEAEWEYAARAGTTSVYSFGNDADSLGHHAWYRDNSEGRTHPVGQKEPNPWGLYDMYGNVYEWLQDWYGVDYYARSPVRDPRGPSGGSRRALRGGCWFSVAKDLRSARRYGFSPEYRDEYFGVRLAASPVSP
jgi:formylglycine-generating enzyme required for sulfatase activity